MNRRRRKLRFVDPPPAPVYTGPESLAGFLFMEYAGSPSDKLGIVLLDRDGRVIGRELILNSNVTATCYTPELVAALLKGSCSLVPFSYKPRPWSPWANHDPKPDKPEPNRVLRAPTVAAAGEVPGVSPEMES